MKKIVKNRGIQIGVVLVALVALILLCLFNRYDENVITKVRKVLWAKYYNIECINEECEFVAAYKGDKNGKTTIKIINSNGKIVGKYKETYSKKSNFRKAPIYVTKNYIILSLRKNNDTSNYGFIVTNTKGKKIYETKNSLYSISDKFFYEKKGDAYNLYNYEGTLLYENIKNIEFYNNKEIISFSLNDELIIIDKKSNVILNGYSIKEEIKNNKKTLYLIVEDKNKSYHYFDVKDNKILGDSFNSYILLSNNKLLVSRKENNGVKKEIIGVDGKIEKEISSISNLHDKLISKVDLDNYLIFEDSIISPDQKGLLVKDIKDNSFGTYDISTKKYEKLYNFKDYTDAVYEEPILTFNNLYEDENNAYFQVGCSLNYCNEKNIIVYNPYNNNVSYKVSNPEKEIKKYREYENGFKVITYIDNTYTLLNKANEELLTSAYDIEVVDSKTILGKKDNGDLLLYSSKENKLINSEETLAIEDNSANYSFYKFFTDDYLYLYSNSGNLIKEIPIRYSKITVSDKYISYLTENKINLISLDTNKTVSYKLNQMELVEDIDGASIKPYKGAIIITDHENNIVKVANYYQKTIKKIKKSKVKSIGFDKKNNKIFLIVKQDKKYGLYIIK